MLTFLNTRPHVTVSLFRCDDPGEIAAELVSKLEALSDTLPTAPAAEEGEAAIKLLEAYVDDNLSAAGGWYRIEKPPSWFRLAPKIAASGPADEDVDEPEPELDEALVINDVQNHLVVVASYKTYIGIFASQDAMRQRLAELVEFGSAGTEDGSVSISRTGEPIDRIAIENAFVRGKTKSAWLEGLHVSTDLKADRKILSGPNLRYALDHFDDQTFSYSAAISELNRAGQVKRVGVSHSKGTLWTKSTKQFAEFAAEIRLLVDALEAGESDAPTTSELERAGLPIVARPAVTENLKNLDDGFDVGYEAPTTQEETLLAGEIVEVEQIDDWQRNGSFLVDETATSSNKNKAQIVAKAMFDGEHIATIRLEPIKRNDTSVEILHRVENYQVRKDDMRMVFLDRSLMKRNSNLTLRYGSGHVVQKGVLFSLQFKDVIFEDWRWSKFAPASDGKTYKVKDEKPTRTSKGKKVYAPDLIGKSDSLFCYVRNNVANLIGRDTSPVKDWHLLCDDGSGEIADFIALSPTKRFVTFVHVKANSKGSASTISVTPFSEVVSQATKNLRNFDQALLSEGIRTRTTDNNKGLVWRHDGAAITREDFCTLLDQFRPNADRHVIILQPRINEGTWNKAVSNHRANKTAAQVGRMRQLSGLLSAARNTFNKLGATIEVVGIKN